MSGLARVTVSAPQRRLDVALPEHVPVAELLPELLHHAGEALPDEGEEHGGWLLRRTDGDPLVAHTGLHAQGVRDGEILHLVPARQSWPELEYDDVVDAIAAGARRIGRSWSPGATRATAAATAGLALAVGLLALAGDAVPRALVALVALGTAVLLLLAGVTAARAYGDGPAGAALAGFSMPYAVLGGARLVSEAGGGAAQLLVGSSALVLVAVLGAVGVAAVERVFVAGATAGVFGAAGALLGFALDPAGAAAIVLAVLACGVGALPLLAIRLGKLPMPPVTLPASEGDGLAAARERPEPARVLASVRRTDELLTGMLIGHAIATVDAVVLLAPSGLAGPLLVGICAVVLLLRARLFATVRQRVPVLAAGLASLTVLAVDAALFAGSGGTLAVLGIGVALALMVVIAGTTYARRPPSPYLGRAADILDLVLVVSVVPVACAVLGLYARVRGLAG